MGVGVVVVSSAEVSVVWCEDRVLFIRVLQVVPFPLSYAWPTSIGEHFCTDSLERLHLTISSDCRTNLLWPWWHHLQQQMKMSWVNMLTMRQNTQVWSEEMCDAWYLEWRWIEFLLWCPFGWLVWPRQQIDSCPHRRSWCSSRSNSPMYIHTMGEQPKI